MSNNQGPARVRVVAAGAPAPMTATPQRRRTDLRPQQDAARRERREGRLTIVAFALFLMASAAGGVLATAYGVKSLTDLPALAGQGPAK